MQKEKTSEDIVENFRFNEKKPERFDVFVAAKLQNIPRKMIQRAILKGKIKLNGVTAKPKTQLRQNDAISVELQLDPTKQAIQPQKNTAIQVIEENTNFMVINKPIGVSVHPSKHEHSNTVVNWILYHFPEIKEIGDDSLRPGIVHRLDKKTSGILIIAKDQKSFKYFKQLFLERRIKKTYYALCWGLFQKNKGEISTFIGRSSANPLKQATSANQTKLIIPKKALTRFEVIEKGTQTSLVKVNPHTGRKHQIRIHLQSIAHPIVGDNIYSTKRFKQKNKKSQRLMLHAQKIEFTFHNGKKYSFKAKLPNDFVAK